MNSYEKLEHIMRADGWTDIPNQNRPVEVALDSVVRYVAKLKGKKLSELLPQEAPKK